MRTDHPGFGRLAAFTVLLAACGASSTGAVDPQAGAAPPPVDAGTLSILAPDPPPEEPEEALYPFDEALADALSGPLEHIGTGPWHGMFKVSACAYHNDKVIVVNIYCTPKEMRAFRIDVLHPRRGRVTIYAEAEKPISKLRRADYFTFKGESQPAPPEGSGLPRFSLSMSMAELQRYDEERYKRFDDACWTGVEIHNPSSGCLRGLKPMTDEFVARNQAFFAEPPVEWYTMVAQLRSMAPMHGRPYGK